MRRQNVKKMYAVWVNLNPKCLNNYQMPKPYIISLEDLFDPESGDVPTLVENDMTNKIWDLSYFEETSIP